MHHVIRKKGIAQPVIILVFLLGILFMSHCKCWKPAGNEKNPPPTCEEVIVFFGGDGVGKGALCNSIFQQNVFHAGLAGVIGNKPSTQNEEYIYENRKYINVSARSQEIGKAFKENNKYKIIFVTTFSVGDSEIAGLINRICSAIKADFEYAIIVNKVTKKQEKKALPGFLSKLLASLNKQPSLQLIIEKDLNMEDADDVYFPADAKSRKELLKFINDLPASKISPTDVQGI